MDPQVLCRTRGADCLRRRPICLPVRAVSSCVLPTRDHVHRRCSSRDPAGGVGSAQRSREGLRRDDWSGAGKLHAGGQGESCTRQRSRRRAHAHRSPSLGLSGRRRPGPHPRGSARLVSALRSPARSPAGKPPLLAQDGPGCPRRAPAGLHSSAQGVFGFVSRRPAVLVRAPTTRRGS